MDTSALKDVPLKALIADDDIPTRMLLRTAMTQWGYEVIEASNGDEAWKILNNANPPHLLVVDWMMPIMDGLTLCKKIRQELSGFFYIILLTQLTGSTNINQALEAGADEFLSKPFNMAELRNRLLIGARILHYEDDLNKQQHTYKELNELIDKLRTDNNVDNNALVEKIKNLLTLIKA